MYPEHYEEIKAGKRKPEELFETRIWVLKNSAVVRMIPWKEGYSEKRHAEFACNCGDRLHSRLLDNKLISECNLQYGR